MCFFHMYIILLGAIPLELSDLVNLEYLNLESNTLTSKIPPSLANLTKLLQLGFAQNNLTGEQYIIFFVFFKI